MKQRGWTELVDDPRFPFMVGRLIGAAEGAGALLRSGTISEEQQAEFARRLDDAARWFIETSLGAGNGRAPKP